MSTFSDVPVEEDTTILVSLACRLGERDALYQQWLWSSIGAESLIFHNEDIVMLSDAELEKEVRASPLVKSDEMTISRSDGGYTFVNFNFETA